MLRAVLSVQDGRGRVRLLDLYCRNQKIDLGGIQLLLLLPNLLGG